MPATPAPAQPFAGEPDRIRGRAGRRRRSPRPLLVLLTCLALMAGLVVAAPPSARADAAAFQLNGTSFGANATVLIELGTLTRDCDFIETASSVYVVPTGTVGPGSSLSDVSGSPNVITSFLLGGAIIDEVVAITAPGGSLGPGTYDLVEDTCQNGVFDGSDSLLSPAFTVALPTDVPTLPSGAISALKAGAAEQRDYWTEAAYAYSALFAAYTAYSLVSDALDPQGFYLTYVCAFLPSHPDPSIPITPYCPTVGIDLVIRLQLEVVRTILNKAAHYNGIAADPPDPDFVGPALVGPAPAFSTPTGDPVEASLAAWADVVGQDEVLAESFLGSLEKYQGAQQAGDAAAALMHARALRQAAVLIQERKVRESERLDAAFDAMAAAGFDPDAELAGLRAHQQGVGTDGFSADEVRHLRNMGLDADAIAHLRQAVVDDIDLTHPFADMTAVFNGQVAANNRMGSALIDLANALSPVITDLEALVALSGRPAYPVVEAGGALTGQPGTPIAVSATCDSCSSVAWDLDGDGAFDDASTISTTVSLPAGSHLVGVRGEGPTGLQAVDYVPVTVTATNRPPLHTAVTPATGRPAVVDVGGTRTFAVTASDPDGDPVTTEWFDGAAAVGTGSSHDVAGDNDRPTSLLRAVSSDPAGGRAGSLWFVEARHPDADADGWTANVDCVDTDPAVNPGATEVGGNGVDDDCDPRTPDAGPPVASFTTHPAPAIVGEPVALTDTSTDPEGQLASWHWDLDGDDADDANSTTVTHTFAAPGTYPVTLRVVDQQGLEARVTKDVVVTDRPVASFTWAPPEPQQGDAVTFTSTSTDADGIATVAWDFSYDGTTFDVESTEATPTRTLSAGSTVALRVTDTLGAVSAVATRQVAVAGPPVAAFNPRPANGGTNVALAPFGATVAGVSSQHASYPASELLDVDYPSSLLGWRTATNFATDQWVTVDLGRPYLIDRLRVQPTTSTTARPARVTLGLGESAGVATVVTTELANAATLQEFTPAVPTTGRYVRLDVLTNRGATYSAVDRLEAWTGQVGSAEVTFTDLSTDPDGDVVAWQWDFGHGGQTSTDRNPTHTFPGPGDYTVTLTVKDAAGRTATTSLVQTVVGPTLVPAFSVPASPREGSTASFTDTTPVALNAVVDRQWSWGDGTGTGHTTTGSHVYPDNGTYDVTLTLTDAYGFRSSTTRSVTVANAAPTANAGPDQSWWVDQQATFTGVSVGDAGTADRPSLQCRLEYGDGAAVDVSGCTASALRAPHTYTEAGTYAVRLTVTDKDGASTTDTATHTVRKRPTYLSAQVVPGSARGGGVDVRVLAWDADTWQRLAGVPVVVDVDGHRHDAVTDAEGALAVRLPWTGPTGTLTATLAETRERAGASDSDPIAATQRPPGDVFFIVDESGSMGGYQAQMRANIVTMAQQLGHELDHQIGVAGLPGTGLFLKVPPTDNLDQVVAGANALGTSNGGEYGIDGIVLASRPDIGWRPGAGKCLVLIGDEPTQRRAFTVDQARQALADNGVVLYSIITVNAGTLDYQQLATGSGGAYVDINAFRTDPQPVLQTLVANCAAAITERPDLNVTIDNGRDTVDPAGTVDYTVALGNTGLVDATGVTASVTLPAGLTFVAASDGGTAAGGTVTWPPLVLASGGSVTRTVTALVDAQAVGTLTVTATVADDGTHGDDLTPANNTDTDTDEVADPPAPVVVTAHDRTVVVGDPLPAFTFAVAGLPDGVVLASAPVCGVAPGVDTSTPGDFPITCMGGAAPTGFVISEYVPGTLTVETPPQAPPHADAGESYAGQEGAPVMLAGAASDPDGDTLVVQWTVAAGSGVDAGASCAIEDPGASSTSVTCTDDGTYLLTLTASDGRHEPVTDTATLTVANAAPEVRITAPSEEAVVAAGEPVALSALYSDAGSNDTHTYRIDTGDGSAPVEAVATGGRLTLEHRFASAGVHDVTVEVVDDDGGTGSATVTVVVADATAKVTGGGFVTTKGRASFGFVAQADAGGFRGQLSLRTPGKDRFHGSTVDRLTVSGRTAAWSGGGRWNGVDGYRFEAHVEDRGTGGGKKPRDLFSIRVLAPGGAVVFETAGELAGGNVTVHT